jgi:glutathione S-transferase
MKSNHPFFTLDIAVGWRSFLTIKAAPMSLILFELAGQNDFRFSPFAWRSKMALHHKGLEFTARSVKFSDRSPIAQSGQERIPVLVDGDTWIPDSWAIAEYLDTTFPDQPSLFGGEAGRAHARFVNSWADTVLNGGVFGLIVRDILDHVHEDDVEFFRSTREKRIGKSLEEMHEGREDRVGKFRASLQPLRQTLTDQAFLGGLAATYADHIVFGSLQWARCCSPFQLLAEDDAIAAWFDRMLDQYGGVGRNAPGYHV